MPFNRLNLVTAVPDGVNFNSRQQLLLLQQLSTMNEPVDYLTSPQDLGPLVGDWSYGSSVDLLSLNPDDISPLPFDFGNSLINTDKDLLMGPFSIPIKNMNIPSPEDSGSLSSVSSPRSSSSTPINIFEELDSHDQIWPIQHQQINKRVLDQHSPMTQSSNSPHRTTPERTSPTSSSSPATPPGEYLSPTPTPTQPNKPRSSKPPSSRATLQNRNASKRAAHNIIEKRYRNNMNAKFLALEQAVSPAGVNRPTPNPKAGAGSGSLKKSEILGSALAHIEKIQRENWALREEIALLTRGPAGRGDSMVMFSK